jgi:hypothetical protein
MGVMGYRIAFRSLGVMARVLRNSLTSDPWTVSGSRIEILI